MRVHSVRKSVFLVVIAAVLTFLGCVGVTGNSPGSHQATPAQNATISASASPATIAQGQSTTLSWTTTNATGVTIDAGIGAEPANGNVAVKPSQTTTYHLVANASTGANPTASVVVTVNAPTPPPGPPPNAPTVKISANPATIAPGQSTTLTVTATNATGVTITNNQDSNKFTLPGSGGTQQVSPAQTTAYTATATGVGGTQSASTTVTVGTTPPPPSGSVQITTWHADNARSGANLNETILTPANVKSGSFGKLFSVLVDGYLYAEPLYMSGLNINGGTHNVVFVATEFDSVYAFDADNYNNNTPLWHASLLGSGQNALLPGPIKPWIGITATPVIDASSGTMYVVTATTAGHFLHALNILTGGERAGSPVAIQASVPSSAPDAINGMISLVNYDLNRASLLLSQGRVYVAFGNSQRGWILGYDEDKLTQVGVLCITPNQINAAYAGDPFAGTGGIWGGGGGPAADAAGNIYVVVSDGPFGVFGGQHSWSESILKLDRDLNVTDSFTPFDYQYQNCKDDDLGSATATLLSDSTGAYLLTGEKNGKLYLLNRGALGGLQNNDAGAAQTLWYIPSSVSSGSCPDENGQVQTGQGDGHEIYGGIASFQQWVYVAAAGGPMKQWSLSGGKLVDTGNASAMYDPHSNGAAPFVSANGSQNGIIWALDNHGAAIQAAGGATPQPVVLHAYDATNVSNELYNSTQAAADAGPLGIKFTSPVVANGKVYVVGAHDALDGTSGQHARGELDVYGLLK
ncbi:MAG TPA: hypothetical protein VFQ00_04605 [Terriglobales bacterium]|nr:hypothetical protein [Terriglobales bacterium]